MPLCSNQVKYIIGDSSLIDEMEKVPALKPFDDRIVEYLDTVSRILLKNNQLKQYPDVITFAFWCRKASVISLEKSYKHLINRIGRGIAFHIAPSNVAVNFAYSLVTGLLSGNANIVRLPSKEFEQVDILCEALKKAMNDEIRKYICVVKYMHNQEVTDCFSKICDSRIIWGGDQTISTIRKSSLKPRAIEICFADRYSISIINADEYLKETNKNNVLQSFFNDTYLTDQNACTSPHFIAWTGNEVAAAQEVFWSGLNHIVKEKYSLQPIQAVNKYTNFCRSSIEGENIHLYKGTDNYITRVKIDRITDTLMELRGNSGYFMEYEAKTLEELLPLCSSQCQTVSYYGVKPEEIREFVMAFRPRGVDRIVPIGKTMDFSLVWDGYDMIMSLSREICIV